MKKLFLLLLVLVSITSFSQKGKDKEPPVIEDASINGGVPLPYGDFNIEVRVYVTDNLPDKTDIYQVIAQIDPCGPTYVAGPKMERNCSFWGATDFYKEGLYVFYADDLGLTPGEHTLRVTVYDRSKNETQTEIKFYVN